MRKIIIQVPMEEELVASLDAQAAIREVSRAALIRASCLRYLREIERVERERRYEEGYARIPDEADEQDTTAWLAAALL